MTPVAQPLLDTLGLPAPRTSSPTISLPSFDNSAMDGYAVRQADVAAATDEQPVTLPVVGEIGAGQATLRALAPGHRGQDHDRCPDPAGADAVVPYEWTDRGVARVRIDQAPEPGQHVRPAGDDVTEGDLLVEEGTVLGPRHLGLLAVGRPGQVQTRPRPRVVVLSTGSELRDPGQELGHDSIYDGNSYLLAAAVRRAGAIAYRVGIVPDEPGAFLETLDDQLVRADLVVTSGGVSMGDYDVVKEALRSKGGLVRPGRDAARQAAGIRGDRRGQGPDLHAARQPGVVLHLLRDVRAPGDPHLDGAQPGVPPAGRRPAHARRRVAGGRRQFLRGRAGTDAQGRYVEPVGGPGSHLIGALAEADCLIVVPEQTTALGQGDRVQVLMLDSPF